MARDSYVGYVPSAALGAPVEPTHQLAVLRSFVYPGPSIKAPPAMALSLGARLRVLATKGDFAILADGGHVERSRRQAGTRHRLVVRGSAGHQ